jgi:lysophospholipase L1-like esterase
VTIPPGAEFASDPVALDVPALATLAVSLHFPEAPVRQTGHPGSRATSWVARGNQAGALALEGAKGVEHWYQLAEVEVEAPSGAAAIVAFGDSITDGHGVLANRNTRWPDLLAERLLAAPATRRIGMLNLGIGGNRLLLDGLGPNALARFDRDVLSQPRADTVIVMMGINDLGWPGTILVPKGEPAPSAEDVIAGYQQLIARAHEHGMTILGATLTPFEDTFHGHPLFGYYNEEKEAKRAAVNQWIRTSGQFDGVIDFDAAARDPAIPKLIKAEYDSGDHLHPQDVGYNAMADSIDLKLLGVKQ